MNNRDFCHLHVHNEFSYLDGYGTAKQYVTRAKELDFSALGLTNHGNIDGFIEFQKKCREQEIVPVLGCEAYIVPDLKVKEKGEKRGHVTLLIKNQQGFENLCKMLTIANLEGMYYKPRIDYSLLIEYCKGLIVLTGCSASFLNLSKGMNLFDKLYKILGDDLYIEIMPLDFKDQIIHNEKCLNIQYPEVNYVATNDCHYVEEGEDKVQEVLLAVQSKAKWDDPKRWKFGFSGLYLKTANEMLSSFRRIKVDNGVARNALETTMGIVDKCKNFSIERKQVFLPKVPGYENKEETFLLNLAYSKVQELCEKGGWNERRYVRYVERLEGEWRLIKSKKFILYFMIVWELINWCKKNNIMIGPGRGSGPGSLFAYLLNITSVDPIKYKLLFSRFISEDRIDFPDIDIDFEDKKRHLVRQHLGDLYGEENVASLSTFLTMKGRAAIRDVCRVFDVNQKEVDFFSKSIEQFSDDEEGGINEALKTVEGKEFYRRHEDEVELAIKLQGQKRSVGQHAAGVIISAENLREGTRGNLCIRADNIVINWSMDDAEYMGLMKLDILGLNTLSILNETKRLIKINRKEEIIYEKILLDDPKVYSEISDGNNIGVFQLNLYNTSRFAQNIKCENIFQLSDIIALVRPGPSASGMTEMYIKRKINNWKSESNTVYDKIVRDTYGIIVYQEQIMEVIYKVAGLSYSIADKIRKVISKKRDAKEFKPFKKSFLQGCLKEGIFSRKEGLDFWEMLQSHAGYSFNRSHSISYAILSYWTMYVKLYYPNEFICANMTFGSEGKKEELIQEAYRLGLNLVLPGTGLSDPIRWTVKDTSLYIPFVEIKGIGEKLALQAVENNMIVEKSNKIHRKYEGFFTSREEVRPKEKKNSKLEKLLEQVRELKEKGEFAELSKMFSFSVRADNHIAYPNLEKIISRGSSISYSKDLFKRILTLDVKRDFLKGLKLIKQIKIDRDFWDTSFYRLKTCMDCELGNECKEPVYPSIGTYNIGIWGEAPGKEEDEQGRGFVGKAGRLLWSECEKYKIYREDLYVSNCCKCFPSKTGTPTIFHIQKCSKWLKMELQYIKSILILAFGNTGLKCFSNRESGITDLSGSTEWSEKYNAWICWCVHPSAVLRNPGNKIAFEKGIRNFSEKIELLGDMI